MQNQPKSPFHANCYLCHEQIFIPRGEHKTVDENGKTMFLHQEPSAIAGSRQCYSKYKTLN